MDIKLIAEICHNINRAYCESLGDFSQPKWEDAPEWQKQSAINGVKFHLMFPESGVLQSHENWMKEKVETGWKYGPLKDEIKKEHPCIVPYDMLPQEQKAKDYIFSALVNQLKDC